MAPSQMDPLNGSLQNFRDTKAKRKLKPVGGSFWGDPNAGKSKHVAKGVRRKIDETKISSCPWSLQNLWAMSIFQAMQIIAFLVWIPYSGIHDHSDQATRANRGTHDAGDPAANLLPRILPFSLGDGLPDLVNTGQKAHQGGWN